MLLSFCSVVGTTLQRYLHEQVGLWSSLVYDKELGGDSAVSSLSFPRRAVRLQWWLFKPISEFHSGDQLGQELEALESSPVELCAHTELEYHAEHTVATHTTFGLLAAMADRGKRRLDHVR